MVEKWAITGGVTWYWHDLWVCLMVDLAFMDLYGTLNEDMMIHQPYFQGTLFSTPDALENGKWPQRTCSVSAFLGLFTWHSFVACGIRNLDKFHHSLTWNVRPGDASPNPNHHSSDVAVTQWGHYHFCRSHCREIPHCHGGFDGKNLWKNQGFPMLPCLICTDQRKSQVIGDGLWLGLPLHDILRTFFPLA